ncbi:MAG: hypothetical protein ACQ9MH_15645 [Nitrospinales bacterium]
METRKAKVVRPHPSGFFVPFIYIRPVFIGFSPMTGCSRRLRPAVPLHGISTLFQPVSLHCKDIEAVIFFSRGNNMNKSNVLQSSNIVEFASEISIPVERISALTDALIAINQGKDLDTLKPITLEALLLNIADSAGAAGAAEKAASKIVSVEWGKKRENGVN